MKSVLIVTLSLIMTPALASTPSSITEGYCYDQALKYKNFMHKQVLADLESEVVEGDKSLVYTPDRYALDNLEEKFDFTIPTGSVENGITDFKYSVTIEAWINTENEAIICDVLEFGHQKKIKFN